VARKLRVACVGAGSVARWAHMPAYQAIGDIEIVAVSDVNVERAKEMAASCDIPRSYETHQEMFETEQLDCVSVCTPNAFHAPVAVAALEAGIHVICEKPLAIKPADGAKMVAAAKKAGKNLMIGCQHRYRPEVQVLKDYVDRGRLGDVYYGRCGFVRRRGTPGVGR